MVDDFAHHPTAVGETLAGLRASNPSARIWAVFEPRSASSCRRVFQDDFARAFAGADEVLLAPVFRSTLPEAERLSVPHARARPSRTRIVRARGRFDRRHHRHYRARASRWRPCRDDVERWLRRHSQETPAGAFVTRARSHRAPWRLNPGCRASGRRSASRSMSRLSRLRPPFARQASPAFSTSCQPFELLPCISILCGPTSMALRSFWRAAAVLPATDQSAPAASVLHRIPVSYGGPFGPDLGDVASTAGVSEEDLISLHSAPVYRVFMLGFSPGFAYMGPVAPAIALPRRTTPRTRVPAGSVAIAGQQTGIYPSDSPGGWHLIGRTSGKPFDPDRAEPFLFKAGDCVQFYPV